MFSGGSLMLTCLRYMFQACMHKTTIHREVSLIPTRSSAIKKHLLLNFGLELKKLRDEFY